MWWFLQSKNLVHSLVWKTNMEKKMSKGYVIAHFKFTNLDAFMAGYGSKIDSVISQFGGQFLVRGGDVPYAEEDKADFDVIVEFPDIAAAQACMNSNAYKEIKAARTDNTTGQFMIVEGV